MLRAITKHDWFCLKFRQCLQKPSEVYQTYTVPIQAAVAQCFGCQPVMHIGSWFDPQMELFVVVSLSKELRSHCSSLSSCIVDI